MWWMAAVCVPPGSRMADIALVFAVLDLEGSTSAVGQVLAAQTIPEAPARSAQRVFSAPFCCQPAASSDLFGAGGVGRSVWFAGLGSG